MAVADQPTPPDPPPPAAERTPPPEPRGWTAALAGLLAKLEHHRSELAGRRLAADAAWLLDRAETMVMAAEDLAQKTEFPAKSAGREGAAIARAGLFVTAAWGVREGLRRGLFGSLLVALTGSGGRGGGPAVRSCLEAAGEALNGYFGLFTERYPSSLAARGWVDAATVFLTDYRQLVRELPE